MRESAAGPLLCRSAQAAPFVVFAAVYLVMAGHGFIRDDYQWILSSRLHGWHDVPRLLHADNGFYRPLVALTFTIDGWLFGAHPYGYGLTNIALALGCAAAIRLLARALSLPPGAAVLAGALWISNPKALGMAVLWISGRTSLLVTLMSVMAATAWLRGRLLRAAVFLLAALLAKEEAVLLPCVFAVWAFLLPHARRGRRAGDRVWPWVAAAAVEAIYWTLRASTHAMTPATAPGYYALTYGPGAILRNAGEYLDRTGTLATIVLIIAAIVMGRSRPLLDARSKSMIAAGAAWWVFTIAPMILLPSRSDLYACLPSVGVALAASAVCARLWDQASPRRRHLAVAAALVIVCALGPVDWIRSARWVSVADFSSSVMADLETMIADLPARAQVVVYDDPAQRENMASGFSSLLDDAYEVETGRRLHIIVAAAAGDPAMARQSGFLRLRVAGRHLILVP